MMDHPQQILQTWLDYVNARNLEGVLGLYHEEATLLPTFSNKTLNQPSRIRDYFERLAGREELRVDLHAKTVRIQALSDRIHVLSGIYRWHLEVDGEGLSFEARFTYAVNLDLERPILHHHSSQVPRML